MNFTITILFSALLSTTAGLAIEHADHALPDLLVRGLTSNDQPVAIAPIPSGTTGGKTPTRALEPRYTASLVNTGVDTVNCDASMPALVSNGGDGISVNDCVLLGQWAASIQGYWELSGFYSAGNPVISLGTCQLVMSRNDGSKVDVRVGNTDIQKIVAAAIYGKSGTMASQTASINCFSEDTGSNSASMMWQIQPGN